MSEFEALLDKHTNLPEGLLPGPVTVRAAIQRPYYIPKRGVRKYTDEENALRKTHPRRTPPEDQLYMYLKILASPAQTWDRIGLAFGTSESTVWHTFNHVQDVLYLALLKGPDRTVSLHLSIPPTPPAPPPPDPPRPLVIPCPQVRWPEARETLPNGELSPFCREALSKMLLGLPGCIGYIDGTRIRIPKPMVGQGVEYSGKIKAHCLNHQVCVDLYGR